MIRLVIRRMRRRVLMAWVAQVALVLGLAITVATAASIGIEDWSFIAVMVILIAFGLTLWVRFAFGIPLLMANIVYLLIGAGLSSPAAGAADPMPGVRTVVSALWIAGGLLGVVAIALSTRVSGNPRDDIDTTAY